MAIDGVRMSPATLLTALNKLGGDNGAGATLHPCLPCVYKWGRRAWPPGGHAAAASPPSPTLPAGPTSSSAVCPLYHLQASGGWTLSSRALWA